jgi:hypothetical protein
MATLGPVSTQAAILGGKWAKVCAILQTSQTSPAESSATLVKKDVVRSLTKETCQQAFQGVKASRPVARVE